MLKLFFAFAVIVIGFSGAAQAQTMTAAERAACQTDYDKYCKGTMPGGGRIIACLNKNPISEGCKKVLAARKN
jgi:hypothetical protein